MKGVEGAHVFSKQDINGENTRPTYKTIRELTGMGKVKWNFQGRFVVDTAGNVTLPASDEAAMNEVQAALL